MIAIAIKTTMPTTRTMAIATTARALITMLTIETTIPITKPIPTLKNETCKDNDTNHNTGNENEIYNDDGTTSVTIAKTIPAAIPITKTPTTW